MSMKIVGILVVGYNEADRYLEATLKEFARLCDETIIALNNTNAKTEKLIKSYGFKFYRDDREWGKFQPVIKTALLKKAGELKPDWIIALDADEVFDSQFTRVEAEKLVLKGGIGYYFYIVNLWNSEDKYYPQWSFWNIRFYRFAPEYGLEFQKKSLHCGLAPPIVYHHGNYAPFILKHYGLLKPEDREKKVTRYEIYDPRAVYKDRSYYEMLKSNYPGVHFEESEVHAKVVHEVKNYKHKDKNLTNFMSNPTQFVYVRRLKDGKVLDMSRPEWDNIQNDEIRKKQWEFVSDIKIEANTPAPIPPVEKDPLKCESCEFLAGSERGLKTHTGRKHKK